MAWQCIYSPGSLIGIHMCVANAAERSVGPRFFPSGVRLHLAGRLSLKPSMVFSEIPTRILARCSHGRHSEMLPPCLFLPGHRAQELLQSKMRLRQSESGSQVPL
jgi:hypothetical protein